MNTWTISKNVFRIITAILIIVSLYQVYTIMNGYYERNKGSPTFWSLQEKFEYNPLFENQPKELVERTQQLELFRSECFLLMVCFALFEFSRYKENPEKYNEKAKNSWTGKLIQKIKDNKKLQEIGEKLEE